MTEEHASAMQLAEEVNRALYIAGLNLRVHVDPPDVHGNPDSTYKPLSNVWLLRPFDREEDLLIVRGVRHGIEGYCVCRYRLYGPIEDPQTALTYAKTGDERAHIREFVREAESTPDVWNWDERTQFYPDLRSLAEAITTGDYRAGCQAF